MQLLLPCVSSPFQCDIHRQREGSCVSLPGRTGVGEPDEHGAIGPQGLDLLDLLFSKAAKGSSAALKTYWMRWLAVVTARRVHAILFGHVRGFTGSKAPAHQQAADDV
mmetsp:Transcript_53120/g.147323  ORF Transcript_53120/g.147323 Transcript_53120/m.147323 type:complete len:108 (-) Transcript_53120:54-377(-)